MRTSVKKLSANCSVNLSFGLTMENEIIGLLKEKALNNSSKLELKATQKYIDKLANRVVTNLTIQGQNTSDWTCG